LGESKESSATDIIVRSEAPLFYGSGLHQTDYQTLWFTLSRMPWRSLVVVPVDPDGSAAGVATALADVGRRLSPGPVTFLLMTGSIDYPSAEKFVSAVTTRAPAEAGAGVPPRVIVSVPPVVTNPLALAVTGAADAVALCVTRGRTRIPAAERTIHLIGKDRLAGCILM
jgi:hypothetical protein